MEEKLGGGRQYKMILQDRGKGSITGISDVVSLTRIPLCWIQIWDF